jgi:hypothetical protein
MESATKSTSLFGSSATELGRTGSRAKSDMLKQIEQQKCTDNVQYKRWLMTGGKLTADAQTCFSAIQNKVAVLVDYKKAHYKPWKFWKMQEPPCNSACVDAHRDVFKSVWSSSANPGFCGFLTFTAVRKHQFSTFESPFRRRLSSNNLLKTIKTRFKTVMEDLQENFKKPNENVKMALAKAREWESVTAKA